jgi:uncharacterized membrane protein HdeD (DUF308 family)
MQNRNLKGWWAFFLRGCIAIMFGFIAFFLMPIMELGIMVPFFGIFIIIQGLLALVAYIVIEKNLQSLPILAESGLGISAGTFLIFLDDVNKTLFIASFVAWGISAGLCKVIRAALVYKNQKFYLLHGINGLLSIVLSSMIYIQAPGARAPLSGLMSIYFVVYGTLLIIFSIRLRASRD